MIQAPTLVASGKPNLSERTHQHHFQRDIHGGGKERGLDRGQRVATGIEGRGEAPHHDEGQEPDGVGRERGAGGRGIGHGEAPRANSARMMRSGMAMAPATLGTVISSANWMPRACARAAPRVSPAASRRDISGRQHGADGNADHADGKLVDAVGVIERRQRAGRQEGGDQRVGEERKLHAAGADDSWPERLQKRRGVGVERRHAEPDADAPHLGVHRDKHDLRHAGDEHAPGGGVARALEIRGEQQRRDQRDIEQHRSAGRGGKSLIGVEHAGEQRSRATRAPDMGR